MHFEITITLLNIIKRDGVIPPVFYSDQRYIVEFIFIFTSVFFVPSIIANTRPAIVDVLVFHSFVQ